MGNELATNSDVVDIKTLLSLISDGDCAKLNDEQRLAYYSYKCKAIGLDPGSTPFKYVKMGNGKVVLYADKSCGEQLTAKHKLSVTITNQQVVGDSYIVTTRVTGPDGRITENMGAVPIKGLGGENLTNAMMKCVTKSHRRTILAWAGLGMLDESEIDSIPRAERIELNKKKRDEEKKVHTAGVNARMDEAIRFFAEDTVCPTCTRIKPAGLKQCEACIAVPTPAVVAPTTATAEEGESIPF